MDKTGSRVTWADQKRTCMDGLFLIGAHQFRGASPERNRQMIFNYYASYGTAGYSKCKDLE